MAQKLPSTEQVAATRAILDQKHNEFLQAKEDQFIRGKLELDTAKRKVAKKQANDKAFQGRNAAINRLNAARDKAKDQKASEAQAAQKTAAQEQKNQAAQAEFMAGAGTEVPNIQVGGGGGGNVLSGILGRALQ